MCTGGAATGSQKAESVHNLEAIAQVHYLPIHSPWRPSSVKQACAVKKDAIIAKNLS